MSSDDRQGQPEPALMADQLLPEENRKVIDRQPEALKTADDIRPNLVPSIVEPVVRKIAIRGLSDELSNAAFVPGGIKSKWRSHVNPAQDVSSPQLGDENKNKRRRWKHIILLSVVACVLSAFAAVQDSERRNQPKEYILDCIRRNTGCIDLTTVSRAKVINNDDVAPLRNAGTWLYQVRIRNCDIDDLGLDNLEKAKLQFLDLSNTKVSELKALKNMNSLTMLSLKDAPVGSEGIRTIGGLTNLMWLDLSGTKITDSDLPTLYNLTKLWNLDVSDTDLSQSAVNKLKAHLPANCRIRFYHWRTDRQNLIRQDLINLTKIRNRK